MTEVKVKKIEWVAHDYSKDENNPDKQWFGYVRNFLTKEEAGCDYLDIRVAEIHAYRIGERTYHRDVIVARIMLEHIYKKKSPEFKSNQLHEAMDWCENELKSFVSRFLE